MSSQEPKYRASKYQVSQDAEWLQEPLNQDDACKNLLRKAIAVAVSDASCNDPGIRWDAQNFLRARSKKAWGFGWMCDILDLDPEEIIEVIKIYEKRRRERLEAKRARKESQKKSGG